MKIFANRSIWKKIVIIFSLIFSMSFVEPAPVKAGIGGTLMEPICDLLVGLGDGFINITHHILAGQETTLIRVNLNEGWLDIVRIAVTIVAFVAVVAAAALITGGAAIAIGAVTGALAAQGAVAIAASAIFANIVPIAVLGTYFGVKAYSMDAFDNELDLPMYSISPERIFSNTVPFFDVNFFNPNSAPFKYEWIHKTTTEELAQRTRNGYDSDTGLTKYTDLTEEDKKLTLNFSNGTDVTEQLKKDLKLLSLRNGKQIEVNGTKYVQYEYKEQEQSTEWIKMTKKVNNGESGGTATEKDDDIAKGEGEKHAFSYELANTVKFWYSIIRTLAIVGMMSVLVYIGIRILLSATAEQKAKHKELLKDWLVGMVLLFTMQYIMVFANIAVDNLTDLLKNINPMGQTALIPDDNGKVESELAEYEIGTTTDQKNINLDSNNNISSDSKVVFKKTETGSDGKTHTYIEWNTDLMGQLRIALQAHRNDNESYIGYTIMYVVMIIYTAIFFITYAKRVIYMAFLTIISPLVALTYPIDKVNDGSAQGFNYWFKEYIFNLLLQPLHLLIYTVLISTAIKFAAENILYSLVVLGFITQAEKIVRAMFNFSKASTPGVFAGPAGAALTMSGIRWLMGHGPRSAGGGSSSSTNSGGSSLDKGITSSGNKTKVKEGMEDLLGDIGGDERSGLPIKTANISNGEENKEKRRLLGIGEESSNTNGENDNPIRFANPEGYINPDVGGNSAGIDEGEVGDIGYDEKGEDIPYQNLSADEYIQAKNEENRMRNEKKRQRRLEAIAIEKEREKETGVTLAGRIKSENNRENFKKFRGAFGDAADAYKDGIKKKIRNNLDNGKTGKFVRKTLGGAIGAATFGTLGVAAGVASGDMKSVMTDGIAGVAGGYKLGSDSIIAASNALNVEGIGDTFERSYLGEEEYKKRMAKRNQLKKAREEDTITKIQQKEKISRVEAKQKAEEYAQVYMEEGINDVDDWILLEKMTKQKVENKDGKKLNRTYTRKEAVSAYKALNRSVANRDEDDALDKIKADYNLKDDAARTVYRTAKVLENLKEGEI